MSRKITILTSLEYLGPYVQGGDQFLGLTVQVSSSDSFKPEEYALFCPWLWSGGTAGSGPSPMVAELVVGATPSTPPAGKIQSILDAPEPAVASLKTKFENDCQKACTRSELGWSNPVGTTDVEATVSDASPRWPAQLAHMARLPFPLPHHLNLCSFPSIDAKYVPKGSLVAGLAFSVNGYSFSPDFSGSVVTGVTPANPLQPLVDSTTGLVTIPCKVMFNGATVPDLIAVFHTKPLAASECRRALRSARNGDPIADGDPYVQLPAAEDRAWMSDLLPKSADLFDTASLLVRGMRLAIDSRNDATLQAMFTRVLQLRSAFLQAALDTSGPGWQNSPGVQNPKDGTQTGASLFDWLYAAWQEDSANVVSAADFQRDIVFPMKGKVLQTQLWRALLQNENPVAYGQLEALQGSVYKANDTTDADTATRTFENLRANWSSQKTLVALLFGQWDTLTTPSSTLNKFKSFVTKEAGLGDLAAQVDLHGRCLVGYLGQQGWGGVLVGQAQQRGKLGERGALRQALFDQMRKTLSDLLTRTAADGALKTAFDSTLFGNGDLEKSAVREDLFAIVPEPSKVSSSGAVSTTVTKVPEGIHLIVSSLASHDSDETGAYSSDSDQKDPARDLSGLCVFARRAADAKGTAGPWLCLNTSVAVLNGDPKTRLTANTVVPVPLHNENGLRTAVLSYNNRPLMGRSPDMALGQQSATQANTSVVDFFAAPMTGISGGDTPVLVFGSGYEFVAGLVSNAGALPPGFGDPQCPGKLVGDITDAFAKAGYGDWENFFANYGCTVLYKRTTVVQELGMFLGEAKKFELPPIPKEVSPRATEEFVAASDSAVAQHLLLLSGYKVSPPLAPSQRSFSFQIQKPQTDLRTWDGWIARPADPAKRPAVKARRAQMWGTFHQAADGKETQVDARLDDPAISSLLVRVTAAGDTLCALDGKPATKGQCSAIVTFLKPTVAPTPPDDTGPPISVTVTAKDVQSLNPGSPVVTLKVVGSNVTIVAGAGVLAKLEFLPVIDDAGRCIDAVHHVGLPGEPAALAHGAILFLETATDALPQTGSLAQALSAMQLGTRAQPGSLEFSLKLDEKADPAFRNVHRTMLNLQSWLWDGRAPHQPFPRDVIAARFPDLAPSGSANLDTWVTENFYNRGFESAATSWMSPSGSGTLTHKEDVTNQPGLLFYHYWVVAFSRYEGMLPPPPKPPQQPEPVKKRAIVPLRWKGDVPKPAIKAMLPLTSSLDEADSTASLLVIVQGPWFTLGGLSEVLLAELIEVTDEKDHSVHIEAGPDPLRPQPDDLLSETYDWPASTLPQPQGPPVRHAMELEGPVGHTRDANVSSGRMWIHSSFVLPPVRINGKSVPWEFAKVRLRRGFAMNGLDAAFYEVSEPSAAFSVQYLPNNDLLETSNSYVSYGDVSFRIQNTRATLIRNGAVVRFPSRAVPSSTSGVVTIPYLVLTQTVVDQQSVIRGEHFLGIVPQEPDGAQWDLSLFNLEDAPPTGARILHIETRNVLTPPTSPLNAELWEAVFPQDQTQDAKARIVSISQKIELAH